MANQLPLNLRSDLGLQHLQEQFVHGHLALHLDAVKVLHSLSGRLPQQGQRHEQFASPSRVLLMLAALEVLQGLVESILQLLDRLHVLYVHGVCQDERKQRSMMDFPDKRNERT